MLHNIDDHNKHMTLTTRPWVGDFPPTGQSTIVIEPIISRPIINDDMLHFRPQTSVTVSPPPSRWSLCLQSSYVVATIDLPGCRFEDIELSIEFNVLVVRSRRGQGETRVDSVALSQDCDLSTAEASLENAVLTVRVNKRPMSGRRRIAIVKL